MNQLNLYQKLIKVRESVKYLQKGNKGDRFNYVSSSQVLGAIRQNLDKHNVYLKTEIINAEVHEKVRSNGNIWNLTCVTLRYTWINADNPEEQDVSEFYAQGLDDSEKGVGKACTYGEKYFLLKSFNIPTDKLDPDRFQKETEFRAIPSETKRPSEAISETKIPSETKQPIYNNDKNIETSSNNPVKTDNIGKSPAAQLDWESFNKLNNGLVPDNYYSLFGLSASLGLRLKKLNNNVICFGKTYQNLDLIKNTKMFRFHKEFEGDFKKVWVCEL